MDTPVGSKAPAGDAALAPMEDEAELTTLKDVFQRHATSLTGTLESRHLRAALLDFGVQAVKTEEKQALASLLGGATAALDIVAFQTVLLSAVQLLKDLRHDYVEAWYDRRADAGGDPISAKDLRPCLEDILGKGLATEAEWNTVMVMFGGAPPPDIPMASFPARASSKERPLRASLHVAMTIVHLRAQTAPQTAPPEKVRRNSLMQQPLRDAAPTVEAMPLARFEELFHKAHRRLVFERRDNERCLAEKFRLPAALVSEFRPRLVLLGELFESFDTAGKGTVHVDTLAELLADCGCPQPSCQVPALSTMAAEILKAQARHNQAVQMLNLAARLSTLTAPRRPSDSLAMAKKSDGRLAPRRASCGDAPSTPDRPSSLRGSKQSIEGVHDPPEDRSGDVDFAAFLQVLSRLRKKRRKECAGELRGIFLQLEADDSGRVSTKDVMRGLKMLKWAPQTRQDQAEIRSIMDRVDEDGVGLVTFTDFMGVVQDVSEQLDRLAAVEHKRVAAELELCPKRCFELLQAFRDHTTFSGLQAQAARRNTMDIVELRALTDQFQLRITGEEMRSLFDAFARADAAAIDAAGFLRLMHTVETTAANWHYRSRANSRGD